MIEMHTQEIGIIDLPSNVQTCIFKYKIMLVQCKDDVVINFNINLYAIG